MRSALKTAVALTITAAAMCGLAGCSSSAGVLLQVIGENDGVADVESRGGGYSDSEWVVRVTPEQGLSETAVRELAESVAHDLEAWSGPTPQVIIELGSFELSVPTSPDVIESRVDNWAAVRDDARVLGGIIGESTGLRSSLDDAFALSHDFSTLDGGVRVSDDLVGVDWTFDIIIEPGCDDIDARLDTFEREFRTQLVDGRITYLQVNPCGSSVMHVSDQSRLLSTAASTVDAFAEAELVEEITLGAATEDASGVNHTWMVWLPAYTPEVAELLTRIYSMTDVTECQLRDGNALLVSVVVGPGKESVEEAIAATGIEFDQVNVLAR